MTNRAFTLVELAIVLTIIGLLIGGVLKGEELLNNARVTATIKGVTELTAVYTSFRDTYSQIPGDMATARGRLPGCDDAHFCVNGNGDSYIGQRGLNGFLNEAGTTTPPQVETSMFWKHLMLAGLISGVDPGANPVNDLAWGATHRAAPGWTGGFHVIHWEGFMQSQGGNYLRWQAPVSAPTLEGPPGSFAVSPKYAAVIDRKMDNGKPQNGFVFGGGRTLAGIYICATPPTAALDATYLETETSANCFMFFSLGSR